MTMTMIQCNTEQIAISHYTICEPANLILELYRMLRKCLTETSSSASLIHNQITRIYSHAEAANKQQSIETVSTSTYLFVELNLISSLHIVRCCSK